MQINPEFENLHFSLLQNIEVELNTVCRSEVFFEAPQTSYRVDTTLLVRRASIPIELASTPSSELDGEPRDCFSENFGRP